MKQILDAFFFAVSYFSIIPVFVKNMEIKEETYKYTLFFLPLVGTILGSIVIGLNLFLNEFFNPLYSSFVVAVLYLFYMVFYIRKLFVMLLMLGLPHIVGKTHIRL